MIVAGHLLHQCGVAVLVVGFQAETVPYQRAADPQPLHLSQQVGNIGGYARQWHSGQPQQTVPVKVVHGCLLS